jgi:predicted transposase YbfD/YdcC
MSDAEISFLDFFQDLEDPRIDRKKLYSMEEILLTTLCAVIAGAEGWQDVEAFGLAKECFLKKYLPFENGIPSDDTFRRFFRAIDPKNFQNKFIAWVESLGIIDKNIIAIDGKTSRRSFDNDKKPLHLISAFASEARIVLAQKKVDTKTNEITEIPQLLSWLDLRKSIVTIDAMGCQKEIANQIIEQGGDYVLALKGNQGQLSEDVRTYFEDKDIVKNKTVKSFQTIEKGHGRIETRRCLITEDIYWLESFKNWKGLQSIVMVESTREEKDTKTIETRYYISSLKADPEKMLRTIRSHWGIENGLHWILDMSFGEDQSRIRKGNAPENMAVMRHCALNMLQKYKGKRQSIKGLRKLAGWKDEVLEGILNVNLKF